jgi:hypothetical protein
MKWLSKLARAFLKPSRLVKQAGQNPDSRKEIEGAIRDAPRIVRIYGRVIEESEKLGMQVPESLLPYSKDTIKNALLICAACEADEKDREKFKICYGFLADFIPDEDAKASIEAHAALNSLDLNLLLSVREAKRDKWVSNLRRSNTEFQRLMGEFDTRLRAAVAAMNAPDETGENET